MNALGWMKFGDRELPPYSEPVSPAALESGRVYYSVTFGDDEMMVPIVDTMVFLGRRSRGDEAVLLRFQDAASFQMGLSEDPNRDFPQPTYYECAEGEAKNVFEFEKALEALMRCSLRRRGR